MSGDMAAAGPPSSGLALPVALRRQMDAFRRAVWTIKAIEAVCGAAFGVLLAWLSLFLLDRVGDTSAAVRWGLFAMAVASCSVIPVAFHRWIWSHRGLESLARLIARRFPSLGDQLLGVVEIVRSRGEQDRSRALCEAAIGQVAEAAGRCDLREAVPRPRHRLWAWLAAAPLAAALVLPLCVPLAAANTWHRFLAPWRMVERFIFTRVDRLPETLVVPLGEETEIDVGLRSDSQWRPERARVWIGGGPAITAGLERDRYRLRLPPQIAEAPLRLAVGDARQRVRLMPTVRPQITNIAARIRLPDYLGREEMLTKDARGGTLSVVKGSAVTVTAGASRRLSAAMVDGTRVDVDGQEFSTSAVLVDRPLDMVMQWQDSLGLAGGQPLSLHLAARDDEAPTIVVDGLAGRAVLLENETIRFGLRVRDDFGVRQVGLEWTASASGGDDRDGHVGGEKLLAVGGPEVEQLDAVGTFSPAALSITSQTVEVRAFAEDYLPGRGRVYSRPAVFLVMTSADHALWINEQVARWKQQTVEVRDRELELLARNEELRGASAEELDAPEGRRAIREQAAAEKNNGRRLGRLADDGAELVRQALRNPEFDAATLEQLAENVEAISDLSRTRIPEVGELLQDAASAAPEPPEGSPEPAPGVQEPATGVQEPATGVREPATAKGAGSKQGGGGDAGRTSSQKNRLDKAVEKQRELIAEFEKVARRLADVMARLEGTTFVKRLKSAARSELQVGEGLASIVARSFGKSGLEQSQRQKVEGVSRRNDDVGGKLSAVMDDLDAFNERRPQPAFRSVLEEMKTLDVLGSLRQISEDMKQESGLSIAQAEFWADTLDRWADELVPSPRAGDSEGGPQENLPPELVLEAMLILEAETNLREETRVAEQIRPSLEAEAFQARAEGLAAAQRGLAKRVGGLIEKLENAGETTRFEDEVERMKREILPGRSRPSKFAKEMQRFVAVQAVMNESRGILASPETGRRAIAAETEAIEMLLETQACSGGVGGGGRAGMSPGGGKGGATSLPAIARLGAGNNGPARSEAPEEGQAIGKSGIVLPEEFRAGLDAYFNAFERGRVATGGVP